MLKEEVLRALEERPGERVTGGDLARRLNVSRTAVWKAVNALKREGISISSARNSGYRFEGHNNVLADRGIRKALRTRLLGNRIELLKTVDSTSSYLKKLDPATLQEGFVVVADGQTAGRGRRGRPFRSPGGEGVYMSVLLKPDLPLADIRFLTIGAALAVCSAVEKTCGVSPQVKWVNDIYCRGRKLCGILTEGSVSAELQTMNHVVVGIGINTGILDREVGDLAISLRELTDAGDIRNLLIAEVLNAMEIVYTALTADGRRQELLEAYREKLFVIGQEVEVAAPGENYPAVAVGLDETGGLMVRDGSGRIRHLCSEEISVRVSGRPGGSAFHL